jgi:hypothetical protein
LPREVDEFGIGAYGNYLSAGFFECFILLCQSSKFRCSHKGKVGRVEEQNGPLFCRFLCGEADLAEIALCGLVGFKLEIRHLLADPDTAAITRHDVVLLRQYRIFKTLIYHITDGCQAVFSLAMQDDKDLQNGAFCRHGHAYIANCDEEY